MGFEPTCPSLDKTISSRSRYDHFDTSPYLIFKHRLARYLEKCKISMQDNVGKIGCTPKGKPAVKPFLADKLTKGRESFECCTIDHSDNSPYLFFLSPACKTLGRMRDFGARTAIFRRGTRPRKARRKGICRGQTGQWVTPFRVSPVMTASIPLHRKCRCTRCPFIIAKRRASVNEKSCGAGIWREKSVWAA